MFSLRLFPSLEKPVARPRYLNIEPQRRDFRGIGTIIGLAAFCGIAFALWEPSPTTPLPTIAAASQSRAVPGEANKPVVETTAAAEAEEDQPAPKVKLFTTCAQKATARRDCAGVKAFKEALVNAPAPEPAKPALAKAETPAIAQPEPVAAAEKPAEVVPAATEPAEVAHVQPPQRVAPQKVKRPRVQDDAPVERLVRVYDQIMPDGRRVPVYRRVGSGGYETGTIVGGEYRPTRRAYLEPAPGRYFGLQ